MTIFLILIVTVFGAVFIAEKTAPRKEPYSEKSFKPVFKYAAKYLLILIASAFALAVAGAVILFVSTLLAARDYTPKGVHGISVNKDYSVKEFIKDIEVRFGSENIHSVIYNDMSFEIMVKQTEQQDETAKKIIRCAEVIRDIYSEKDFSVYFESSDSSRLVKISDFYFFVGAYEKYPYGRNGNIFSGVSVTNGSDGGVLNRLNLYNSYIDVDNLNGISELSLYRIKDEFSDKTDLSGIKSLECYFADTEYLDFSRFINLEEIEIHYYDEDLSGKTDTIKKTLPNCRIVLSKITD